MAVVLDEFYYFVTVRRQGETRFPGEAVGPAVVVAQGEFDSGVADVSGLEVDGRISR